MNKLAIINNTLRSKDRNSLHNEFRQLSTTSFTDFKYDGDKIYAVNSSGLYAAPETSFPGTAIQTGNWVFVHKGVRNGKPIIGAVKSGAGINVACFYDGNTYYASAAPTTLESMFYSPTTDRWYLLTSTNLVHCYSADLSTFYWNNTSGIGSVKETVVLDNTAYLLRNTSVHFFSTVSNSITGSSTFSFTAHNINWLPRVGRFAVAIGSDTYTTADFITYPTQEYNTRGIIDAGDFYVTQSNSLMAIGKSKNFENSWFSMVQNPRAPSDNPIKMDYAKRKVVILTNLSKLYISSEL